MQLRSLEEDAADVLAADLRRRAEAHRPPGAGVESVEQQEPVPLLLAQGSAVADAEQVEEVYRRGLEGEDELRVDRHRDAQVGERRPEVKAQRPLIEEERVAERPASAQRAQVGKELQSLFRVAHAPTLPPPHVWASLRRRALPSSSTPRQKGTPAFRIRCGTGLRR